MYFCTCTLFVYELCNWHPLLVTAGCVVHVEVLILKAADTPALMEGTLDSPDAPAHHPPVAVTLIQTEKTTQPSTMHSANTAA